ncbi:WAT1-related protein At1g09380-like [Primulina tabacum]|uniref:WAT1-related protein At1g09380-like n=1 Tax=Primulina tabacum TaxID=48773 RepID=UPI003F59A213
MAVGDLFPFLNMVIVQLGYGGMNIISKVAMDSGMNPFVHVAYRQIFATISIAPFAFFMERVTVNQITYFLGLKHSTPTIACALNNINPAVTFLLAVPLGLEKLGLKSKAGGQAKIWGTIICVGGALLLSFYQGQMVNIGQSGIHWKYAEKTGTKISIDHANSKGPMLLVASAVSWAVWLIIQTRLSKQSVAPYSSSALMCLMSSFQY